MAYKNLVAFGAGEITPELAERSNLEKFQTGLKTLRNGVVTKFGGLRSRRGFVLSEEVATTKLYCPKNFSMALVFGKTSFTVYENQLNYKFTKITTNYTTFSLTLDDLENLHLTNDDLYLYAFVEGKVFFKIRLREGGPFTIAQVTSFSNVAPGSYVLDRVVSGSTPTGYDVDYGFSVISNSVESGIKAVQSTGKLPAGTNEQNKLYCRIAVGIPGTVPEEARLYRRPRGSGAWGFIGSGTFVVDTTPGYIWVSEISDVGQDTDLTNQPPGFVAGFAAEGALKPKTGFIYQNRLLLGIRNKIYGSRTDSLENFDRDFPLQDDGAVAFKTGSSGGANIERMYDGRGLLISTKVGIYETPSDVLKYDTAFAIKKSNAVHNGKLPMLGMGGSTFVNDVRLSGIFKLKGSGNNYDMDTIEVSIFSGHLFENYDIVDWCIQDDGTQLLWMVRDDGVLICLSYQEDQSLQSFSRHDMLGGKFKAVGTLKTPGEQDLLLAIVEREGVNYLEVLSKKDLDVYDYIGTDSTVIYKNHMVASDRWIRITDPVIVDDVLESGRFNYEGVVDRTVADVTARNAIPAGDRYVGMIVDVTGTGLYELVGGIENANWVLYSGPFSNVADLGAVGSVFRFFNAATHEYVDYEVTAYVNSYTVDMELAPGQDRDMFAVMGTTTVINLLLTRMFQTFETLTGLGHLEGQKVAVRTDGFTEASPLNNIRDYPEYTVTGGEVTLENRAAIISVGLPIVTDIQTLDAQSIEQVSAKTESSIVNKLFVSYYKSRGLYVGSDFPEDNTLTDMEDHESFFEPDAGIDPYRPHPPYSRREEVVVQGNWQAGSSTAFRNVDPQPIGVRGILLDEEKIGE